MARLLGDRYDLGEVLGRGGMATVYRATDTVLDRPVAIKMLADRYAGDERFVERFRREAQASARLNHPNIVSVFDTGDEDGAHYIVMEIVEGQTLAEMLRRQGRLSTERSARIAAQVAAALEAAHEQGIVHRDVKPANVMLTPDGDVKVMDFGIARAAEEDRLTQTGVVLGTASYLSPEQSRGAPVDARSDVYSLGCVLREMLTGRPPFTGETPVAIAYKHVNEEPAPPSADDDAITPEIDALVMRSLEKDPERRFATAGAFRAAIADAAAGVPTEPIAAEEDTAVLPAAGAAAPAAEGPAPPADRRWWPAVVGGIVAFVVAALLTLALFGGDDPTGGRSERRNDRAEEATDLPSAVALLERTVEEAMAAETMTEDVGVAVLEEAAKSVDAYERGDLEQALNHLADADNRVEEGLAKGDVTPESAEATRRAIAVLADVMRASPPPPAEEEPPPEDEPPPEGDGEDEGEDEGSGEGDDGCPGPGQSGCAPGQDNKGNDEDD